MCFYIRWSHLWMIYTYINPLGAKICVKFEIESSKMSVWSETSWRSRNVEKSCFSYERLTFLFLNIFCENASKPISFETFSQNRPMFIKKLNSLRSGPKWLSIRLHTSNSVRETRLYTKNWIRISDIFLKSSPWQPASIFYMHFMISMN